MLINGGSEHYSDKGTLNTTVHHCWYDKSRTRNPRGGFGKVHIFNCLYNGDGYCIGLHSGCVVRAERNYFLETKSPIRQMYKPNPNDPAHGLCESVDNTFKDCSGAQDDERKSFPVHHYYRTDFALDNATDVWLKSRIVPRSRETYGSSERGRRVSSQKGKPKTQNGIS